MNLQLFAEMLSAYAAIVTVGMALIELTSRSTAKKAESAIEVYADFLLISQQLGYAVRHVEQLTQHCQSMTEAEIKAFASSHSLNDDLPATIKKIESMSVSTFNHSKAEGQAKARIILEYVGSTSLLAASINTFFASISESNSISPDRIARNAQIIQEEYQQMLQHNNNASQVLKSNLKYLKKSSSRYLIFLFGMATIFVTINLLFG